VLGAGPIGLAVLVAAVHEGARVMAVDPTETRRDLAKHLGAEAVTWAHDRELHDRELHDRELHDREHHDREHHDRELIDKELIAAALDWTGGEGPPLVVETSGATKILNLATEMVAPAGRVVVVGMSSGTAPLRPGIFPEKEIDLLGSSTATAKDFRNAITLVTSNRKRITPLFSHHFPLARAAEAFEFALSRPPDAIKIVVNVN
jgi:L-gulonate 5-dehydrogenase